MLKKLIKEEIKKKMTLNEFAKKHNIRPSTLSDFLNDKRDIRLSTFLKIIRPLDIRWIKEKMK